MLVNSSDNVFDAVVTVRVHPVYTMSAYQCRMTAAFWTKPLQKKDLSSFSNIVTIVS